MPSILSRLDYGARQALICTGVNSIFWFSWSFGSYQTIYLQEVGFTALSAGASQRPDLHSFHCLCSFWGMVSDRIGSLRKVLITVLAGGVGLFALIPSSRGLPYSTALFFCLVPLVYFFRGSMSTYAENLLVRNSNELRLNYGLLRSVGSFLFMIGSFTISFLLPTVGVASTFWLTALLTVPAIVLTLFAREPDARPPKKGEKQKLNLGELFQNRAYVSFLVFGFLLYTGTNCEGTFLPYFMADANIPSERYGIFLGARALLEHPLPAADGAPAPPVPPAPAGNGPAPAHGDRVRPFGAVGPLLPHHAGVLLLLRPGQRPAHRVLPQLCLRAGPRPPQSQRPGLFRRGLFCGGYSG